MSEYTCTIVDPPQPVLLESKTYTIELPVEYYEVCSMNPALYSSNKDDWETPDHIFYAANQRHKFTLDVCADERNHKCTKYFTESDNGLMQTWSDNICWMNPPYSANSDWMAKAVEEFKKGTTVVCLVPARTDTKWFHKYVWPFASVEFFKGRIKFIGGVIPVGGKTNGAPFPSCLVIYEPNKVQTIGPCSIKAALAAPRTPRRIATVCGAAS